MIPEKKINIVEHLKIIGFSVDLNISLLNLGRHIVSHIPIFLINLMAVLPSDDFPCKKITGLNTLRMDIIIDNDPSVTETHKN